MKKLLLTIWLLALFSLQLTMPLIAFAADAPIPDSVQEAIADNYSRTLAECAGEPGCPARAAQEREEAMANAQESANQHAAAAAEAEAKAAEEASNAPIPDSIQEQEEQEHTNALLECHGDETCIEEANRAHDERMANNQETANRNRDQEAEQAAAAAQAKFNDDCYGYPNGDSQDSSDFALKIDCILDTTEQDQSYFNWEWRTAPIEKVIIKAINYLMATIGSVAMLLIVIAGLMMITSPADENQRSKAIEILQSSIIALVVAFSAYIIVNAVEGLFY